MKLKQLGSNKTELHLNDGTVVFFSYETPVAALALNGRHSYIRTSTKYSVTTSRHINQWLDGVNAVEVDQSELDALVS